MTLPLLVAGLGAMMASWLAVHPLTAWLGRQGVLDKPNVRSSHSRVTPRGGGLVMLVTTLIGLLVTEVWWRSLPWPAVLGYVAGVLMIGAVSWLDDRGEVPVVARLLVQGLAALIAAMVVGRWPIAPGVPLATVVGWVATVVWIVGLTNLYNFMDGIDGLAAGQAVVAALGLMFVCVFVVQPVGSMWAVLIAGSAAGFLAHNWQPARVFMGDVGSAFLGYTFAVLPLAISSQPAVALAGLLPLWPFLFDGGFTLLRRLFRGENVFSAHRSHLYQRLVISGFSHARVAGGYVVLALAGLALIPLWIGGQTTQRALTIAVLAALCGALWGFTARVESKMAREISYGAGSPLR